MTRFLMSSSAAAAPMSVPAPPPLSLPESEEALEPLCTPVEGMRRANNALLGLGPPPAGPLRPMRRPHRDHDWSQRTDNSQCNPISSQKDLPDMSQDTLALFPRILETHVRSGGANSSAATAALAKASLISALNRASPLRNPFIMPDSDAENVKENVALYGTPSMSVQNGLALPPPPPAFVLSDGANGRNSATDSLKMVIVASTQARKFSLDFEELGTAGEGDFSEVLKARSRLDGMVYAIKRNKKALEFDSARMGALKEVFALAALQGHPNILRYYSAWFENSGTNLLIQTEFIDGGSLTNMYVNKRRKMSVGKLLAVARDVARALKFMHAKGVLHHDIKPDNIFETHRDDNGPSYVIGDFGLATRIDDIQAATVEGDSRYLCPEAFEGPAPPPPVPVTMEDGDECELEEDESMVIDADILLDDDDDVRPRRPPRRRQSMEDMYARRLPFTASDIFSLGATLYELATAQPLTKTGLKWKRLRQDVDACANDVRTACGSDTVAMIVKECLVQNPKARATCDRVLHIVENGTTEAHDDDDDDARIRKLKNENENLQLQLDEMRSILTKLLASASKTKNAKAAHAHAHTHGYNTTKNSARSRSTKGCAKDVSSRRVPRRSALSEAKRI